MSNDAAMHKLVQEQFGPVANAYTVSPSHASAEALQGLLELVQPRSTDRVLDVATGAGHTALTLAPYVAEVIAFDLTPQMLEETARNAAEKVLSNISTQQGAAEAMPFADGTFDVVTCRIAPHHFADIEKAVGEMARVTRPGGRVVVIDTTVPEDDTLDQEINYIEKQRDPSHVRNYRPGEWQTMFERAGLQVGELRQDQIAGQNRINFADWVSRMRAPHEVVVELAGLMRKASPGLQKALEIEIQGEHDRDIYFTLPRVAIVGVKHG